MQFAIVRTPQGSRSVRIEGSIGHLYDAPPWLGGKESGLTVEVAGALLCPVIPSKIVCIGVNYASHAKETGHELPAEPLLFLKPPSALVETGGTVLLPPESQRVEHEAELAIVIGRRAKNIPKSTALSHVFGYTAACDVSARDIQHKDIQVTRGKSFDTFCPIGPWIETALDPSTARILCRVNGLIRQDDLTAHMLFDVPTLVAYVSHAMTLEPGDVILTGTPLGAGPVVAGDVLEIEISGIGVLTLGVAKAGDVSSS